LIRHRVEADVPAKERHLAQVVGVVLDEKRETPERRSASFDGERERRRLLQVGVFHLGDVSREPLPNVLPGFPHFVERREHLHVVDALGLVEHRLERGLARETERAGEIVPGVHQVAGEEEHVVRPLVRPLSRSFLVDSIESIQEKPGIELESCDQRSYDGIHGDRPSFLAS
jgi:hypothetical protein